MISWLGPFFFLLGVVGVFGSIEFDNFVWLLHRVRDSLDWDAEYVRDRLGQVLFLGLPELSGKRSK